MSQPTRVTQPSIPFRVCKWVVIHVVTWITGWIRQTRVAYGCLVVGQSVDAGLAYACRLYASFVCDMNSAAAAAVFCLWRYTGVICLCLCLLPTPNNLQTAWLLRLSKECKLFRENDTVSDECNRKKMVNSVRLYYMYYKFAKYIHMCYVSREIHTKQCCCAVCTNVGCHCHTVYRCCWC